MNFKRVILYCSVFLIVGLGIGIGFNSNTPTTYVEDMKEAVRNQPCKIVIQSEEEYFYFDGFCFQYEELFENSTMLRKILELKQMEDK